MFGENPKKEKEVRLKVGELTAREEAGRGIVRLDSNTMQKLGIKEGDIVELEGSRKTGAIAVRAYPADVGLNLIRMDGITRRNAGSGVGEYVKIRKADVKEARRVTIAPAEKGIIIHMSPNLIKQNIYMRPVNKGDIIIPSPVVRRKARGGSIFEEFFGMDFDVFFTPFPRETRFVVTNTEPSGIVRVGDITELEILPQLPPSMKLEERAIPAVTYEDIGGIKEVVHKVREMIELPLRHPELFERLGIEPPKGVLLYGPPGCGKTLLAKAVANESGANFISISGPEVTCVDGETLLIFGNSILKAKEVFRKSKEKLLENGNLNTSYTASGELKGILNPSFNQVPTTLVETSKVISQSYYNVMFENGEYNVSPNHPFLVFSENGVAWKIPSLIGNDEYCLVSVIKNLERPRIKFESKIKTPKKFSEKLSFLAGLIAGDGYIGRDNITFCNKNIELHKLFRRFVREIFGLKNFKEYKDKKGNIRTVVYSTELVKFFNFIGFKSGKKEYSEFLDRWLTKFDQKVLVPFIEGLIKSDGHEDEYSLAIYSSKREYLEKIRKIAFSRGLVFKKVKRNKNKLGELYELKLQGRNNLQLFKKLCMIGVKTKIPKRSYEYLPPSVFKIAKQLFKLAGVKYGNDYKIEPYLNSRKRGTIETLKKIVEILEKQHIGNNYILNLFKKMVNREILLDKFVTKVEIQKQKELFDFGTSTENFLTAFGHVMHNSKWYGESLPGNENIFVVENNLPKQIPIEELENKSIRDLKVIAFDKEGKIKCSSISDFIKHPSRSKILEVKTRTGRSIKVTDYHSLFTLKDGKIRSVKTSELIPKKSYIAIPTKISLPNMAVDGINMLSYLKVDDCNLWVRGGTKYVKDAIRKIGIKEVAKVLKITPKYLYDVVRKNIAIRISRFLNLMKEAGITYNARKLLISTKGKEGTIPAYIKLDKSLLRLIGIWVAEGSYSGDYSIRITSSLPEVQRCVKKECKQLGLKARIYANGTIFIYSKPLRILFERILGLVGGAKNKKVPDIVFGLRKSLIREFLKGYYTGDGSVYPNQRDVYTIEATTYSKRLANDLLYLLLYFGIVASNFEDGEGRYRICFSGVKNFRKFRRIGFLDSKRNEKIRKYISSVKWERSDQIPIDPYLRKVLAKEMREWTNSSTIGRDKLLQLLKRIDPQRKIYKNYWRLAEADIFWDEVKEVKEVPYNGRYVYDISVNPAENFLAGCGGIFAHNSEKRIREIFEEAEKNAPSIIFIDEIDALAPKREEVTGEVERRMVSQLLTCMDGLKSRGKVIVIAATNRPHSLDPALRRGGRFDREIEIPVPDRNGRLEILKIHTRSMPLDKDVDLNWLADVTYGFVGADIMILCKEAAMSALRRVLPEIKWKEEKELPKEVVEKLVVTRKDFENALRIVEPSAMREVLVEVPKVRWGDVGDLEDVKQTLKEMIEWPLKSPESFKRMGIQPPKGILLYGPPGCGKTLLAKAVANESGANFISVKGPEVYSMWVGESERRVRELFRRAKQVAPCIIFLDEIDALAPRRGTYLGSRAHETVVSQLLTEMSGLEELKGVVVIAATNRPDIVDPALLRPGRIDRFVLIPAPDEKARLEILKVHTKKMPLKDVNLKDLADRTEGFSGADLEALCREAAMNALRENMKAKEVKSKHFEEALKKITPSLSKEMKEYYEKFVERQKKIVREEKEARPGYIG